MAFQLDASLCISLVALTGAILLVKDVDGQLENRFNQDSDSIDFRLSKDVLPRKYTIRLEPDIASGQFTFEGETDIEICLQRRTSTIVLHALDLMIEEDYTKLLYADASIVNVTISPAYDDATNFYKLNLSDSVPSGCYILKMKYSGRLHDDGNGIYRSSYVNDQGERVWLASTKFEPIYARRAFPCFDEPSFKATFKIFITHLKNYTAVSNMPAVSKTMPNNDTTKWVTEFQETLKMSTYLVAFVVSDFKNLSNSDGTFRVFARSNRIHLGRFAQAIGPRHIAELANYTKIDYKFPKIDNFAIPQYPDDGMENWGLITYREETLIYDENQTTTKTKQRMVGIISHECAHQWFGNLVTPSWWSFVWLSEGFGVYFMYWITNRVEPSWRMMEKFVTEILQQQALTTDSYEHQHPMNVRINHPSEIPHIFDEISYSKSGCVIRMFSHVLTPTVFQTGLQNYLTNKSYQAVTPDDLIRELVAVGKDIEFLDQALASWFTQPGYPVIMVSRNHTTGSAVISQKRFLRNANGTRTERWFVPINLVSEEEPNNFSETRPTYWLFNDTESLTLTGLKNNSWIILNSQQTGYYRVNYDAENWRFIIDYLKNPKTMKNIHVLNRAQLLDDSFHLAEASELPDYSIFLEMTNYLQHEEDFIPWYAAHRAFFSLSTALANTGCWNLFKLYIQRLTTKLEEKLGYTENGEENDDVKMNRINVIRLACAMGSAECLAATHEMLLEHVIKSNKTSADLQSVVLCAGMRSANREEWEIAYNYTIKLSYDSHEFKTLVVSLGCASDPNILTTYLEKTVLGESVIKNIHAVRTVCIGDAAGVNVIFAFIKNNYRSLVRSPFSLSNADVNLVWRYLECSAHRITTQEQITQFQQFIRTLPVGHEILGIALEREPVTRANMRVAWTKKYENTIAMFLDAQDLVVRTKP